MCQMYSSGKDTRISENRNPKALPESYVLEQNYLNPFNPTTSIGFSLSEAGNVRIEIFNMLGQRIKTLVNKSMGAGHHEVIWDARDDSGRAVATGIYFYHLKTNHNVNLVKKMILMK
jgi:flagellar hook assembly protein FlgD